MSRWRLPRLSPQVAIDLGSNHTRVWSEELGQITTESTCLAVDQRTQKVLAIGKEAEAMEGRVASYIKVVYPIQQGIIHDAVAARAFLHLLLPQVLGRRHLFRPVVMVSVSAGAGVAYVQALTEVLYQVGAREVYTMTQPLAAAIGAGVPIADASGSFFIQLGAGRVEAAVISLGSSVLAESTQQAGNEFDQLLVNALKEQLGLEISHSTAEQLKQKVVTLSGRPRKWLVSGRDVASAAPKELEVTSADLAAVTTTMANHWLKLLQKVLSQLPPELTVDAIDKGMLLSGGLSQLDGVDEWLVTKLGVPVSTIDEPEQAVIKGLRTALEHLDLFRQSLGYQK